MGRLEFVMQNQVSSPSQPQIISPFMILPEVMQLTTFKKSKIWALSKDPKSGFPASFNLAPRATRWPRAGVEAWVDAQLAKANKQ
jgi:predicted DNA-binding transcriptional regulator AlpA